jgi:DNA polymerase-3 subunit delta'
MIGHTEQVEALKAAFAGDRPHHAWLLTGPQGLGKALFAQQAAIWLLAGWGGVRGGGTKPGGSAARRRQPPGFPPAGAYGG